MASQIQMQPDHASVEAGTAGAEPSAAGIPQSLADLIVSLGEAEWGATNPKSAVRHGTSVARSVRMTAEHFQQSGFQPMHGLYVAGTGVVLCHTGTSPNSGDIARALTGAWNRLLEDCRAQLAATNEAAAIEKATRS